jgi:hypothetical protein
MPRDPESGGTWIAVTEGLLAFAVLNLNVGDGSPATYGERSRGELIPEVLTCRTGDEVVRVLEGDARAFRPFRLIVVHGDDVLELRAKTAPRRCHLTRPLMFTSSGLGDHLVETPRRALFEWMMRRRGDPVANQDRFHRHRWQSRPHLSVEMERADALTVSRTVVEVGHAGVRMEYWPVGQVEPAGLPAVAQL